MKRKILSNISNNFICRIVIYIFSFLELMYLTRIFQPEIFGRITFVSTVTGYFVMIANLGMPIYAMRMCAQVRDDRKKLSQLFNELWSISIVLSFISVVFFAFAILFVPILRENWLLFAVYGSSILLQILSCEWLYKGLEKFSFLTLTTFVCKVISFVAIIVLVRSAQNVLLYVCLSVLIVYGSNIICFVCSAKYVDRPLRFSINKIHFKPLLVFFMMSCAVSIYSNLDLTMLGFMKTEYEIGLYSVASKEKAMLAITGSLVWSGILPVATKLWKDGNREHFESLAAKSLVIVSAIQSCLAIICLIFAKLIITIIAGESYLGAITSFRILLLSLPVIALSNILGGQVLIPAGKEKKLLFAEIAGAVFNFFANLIIIPVFSIAGAASTTLISEIIVWLLCVYYCKKDLDMDFGAGMIKKTIHLMAIVFNLITIKIKSIIRKDKLPYYCPCCESHLKRYVDGGFNKRPERFNVERYNGIDQMVVCPVCGSFPRHRIQALWMNENMEQISGKKILYFSMEKSMKMWCKRNKINCTTADLYREADLKIDIEDTGLEEDSYDVIVCNHVLEHVSDFRKALKELYRIIKPEGMVIVSFPTDLSLDTVYEDNLVVSEEDCRKHFGQSDHKRIFGRDSKELLESIGFNVSEISENSFSCDKRIKPVVGPADYDYNVLWCLRKGVK